MLKEAGTAETMALIAASFLPRIRVCYLFPPLYPIIPSTTPVDIVPELAFLS